MVAGLCLVCTTSAASFDETEALLMRSAYSMGSREPEAMQSLVQHRRGEGLAAFRRLASSPERFPPSAGDRDLIYRETVAGDLVYVMVRCFGLADTLSAMRDPLLETNDARLASLTKSQGLPASSPGVWSFAAAVASRARKQEIREAGDALLLRAVPRAEEVERFAPETDVGWYYKGLGWLTCARQATEARQRGLAEQYGLKAVAALDEALRRNSRLDRAEYCKAVALQRLEHQQAALEAARRAITLNPSRPEAYRLSSGLHRELGHAAQAEEDERTARRLEEEARERFLRSQEGLAEQMGAARSSVLMTFTGQPATSRPNYPTAVVEHYSTVVRHHPQCKEALLEKGLLQFLLGRTEEALADFTDYLALAPETPYVHYLRARVLAKLGRQAEAAQDLAFWQEHQVTPEPITPLSDLPKMQRTARQMRGEDVQALAQHKDVWKIGTYADILISTRSDDSAYSAAQAALREFEPAELRPVVKQLETAVALGLDKSGSITMSLAKIQSPSSIPYLLAAACASERILAEPVARNLAQFPKEHGLPALHKLVLAVRDNYQAELVANILLGTDQEAAQALFAKVILTGTREAQLRAGTVSRPSSLSTVGLLTLLEIVEDPDTARPLREAAGTALIKTRSSSLASWVEEKLSGP